MLMYGCVVANQDVIGPKPSSGYGLLDESAKSNTVMIIFAYIFMFFFENNDYKKKW